MVSRDHIRAPFLGPIDPVPSDWPGLVQRALAAAQALQGPVV